MEEWKDVVGYEGFYQVSNLGRIKSLQRSEKTNNRWGECIRIRKEKILKLCNSKNGHLSIELNKNGKIKRKSIHRIVYQSFVGKLKYNYCIHHIDFNKKNNCLENLVQVDYDEHNNIHKHESWNKGIKSSEITKKRLSESRKKHYLPYFKEAYELKNSGKTLKEVASILNISTRQVYMRIKNYKRVLNEK